jgi:DNA sulfur modification protein DndB
MPGWDDMTIEEKFQRDVNYSRVKTHIAPYLSTDKDRFFGAFIVTVMNAEGMSFDSMDNVVSNLPKLYQDAAKQFGFLYLQGNELLVPLDGQHRLAALKFAITGRDEKSKEIPGFEPNVDIANDLCTVMLIIHDAKKSRKIFNKVNRYAKPTSKADNIITADDDIAAVIAREEIAGDIIEQRLVKAEKSNTLSEKDHEFTTISTLYEATVDILNEQFGKINSSTLPSTANEKLYRKYAKDFWTTIFEKIDLFNKAVIDPTESGDSKRQEIRKDYTLGKPIIQHALVSAILRLNAPHEDGVRLSLNEICERINQVDWTVENPVWQKVLMNNSKVISGKQARAFAARFIAYMLGDNLEPKEKSVLERHYLDSFSAKEAPKGLPKPLF